MFLRVMVFAVWTLDAVNLFLFSATMWVYLVGKQLSFDNEPLPWMSNGQIVVNAVAIAIIQSFYTYRIWTLTNYKPLTIIVMVFVVADLGLGLLLFMKSVSTPSLAEFISLIPFDIALSTVTTVTDVLLCGTLVTLLAMSRTGSVGADRLINRLLFYTINTGLVTSVCSVASLITVLAIPEAAVYVMCYYIGSRMYTVSLLATLNVREGLRLHAERLGQGSLRGLTRSSNSGSRRSARGVADAMVPTKEIVVAIQRDTTVTFDDRSDSDHKHDTHRRSYRCHPQSPTSSRSQFVGLLSTVSSKLQRPGGSSRELDSEFGPPPRSFRGERYPG
ncbi:hypothetical protein GSI_02410 [Ganoderma sinense ZZ0214-1]|uniref:DUF6534 domain-containing protein n=1 Tax=Ganoderma sinense ZZ0214-1 TaxID=1077348 RepID=A0A2G8SPK2_9APHY|nr:hypothetical protein GSI_02410 [Ganoderma sinense ZZ0214-1]